MHFGTELPQRQTAMCRNQKSEFPKVAKGVPQGSILGPLLFFVYIDDIVSSVSQCEVNLYADDTMLYFTVYNMHSVA